MQGEADRLADEKPEEAEAIREKIVQITELWQELKEMVSESSNLTDNYPIPVDCQSVKVFLLTMCFVLSKSIWNIVSLGDVHL